MVALPLKINPFIVSKLDPQLGALLNYEKAYGIHVPLWYFPCMGLFRSH